MTTGHGKINNQNIQDILSLTPMQEGMLFHYLHDPENYYCEQLSINICGQIDLEIMRKAWEYVIDVNEMLRTVFRWERLPKPIQIIFKKYKLPLKIYDFSNVEGQEREQKINQILKLGQTEKIDIATEPFRITVIKLSAQQCIMIISYHHILYDGWSNGIILQELFNAYNTLFRGEVLKKPNKKGFKEFINWLQLQNVVEQQQFWQDYLEGFQVTTNIPIYSNILQQSGQTGSGGGISEEGSRESYFLKIDQEVTQQIIKFSRNHQITSAAFFYAIWGLVLQRYNSCEDVVFGTTVSGRNAKVVGIEEMVGLFINTIPLRVKSDQLEKFLTVLQEIDQTLKNRMDYENVPLVDIKACSELKNNQTLFDSIVVIENYPLDQQLNHQENILTVESYSMSESTNYDLTLAIELREQITMQFAYNGTKWERNFIKKVAEHFKNMMEFILEKPYSTLSDIEMLSQREKVQLIETFNQTYTDYPRQQTVDQLFDIQAAKTPEKIAVVYKGDTLKYHELEGKANGLARVLLNIGVKKDSVIGIVARRSLEMVIGILAILKAGGAYLPIDPEYPEDRVNHMLEECGVELLLIQGENGKDYNYQCTKIDILEASPDSIFNNSEFDNHPPIQPPSQVNTPNTLAYVIYTSGSTGKPKGVMVEHKSIVRLVKNTNLIEFTGDDKILHAGTLAFDISTFEIWGALLNGLELHVGPKDILKQSGELAEYIINNQISLLLIAAPLFNLMVDERPEMFKTLRYVQIGGDILSPKHVNLLKRVNPELLIVNGYGPTENTTVSTFFIVDNQDYQNIPIGKPISNSTAYILDKYNRLCPVGVCGEICVGGDGLARGYINNPQLTAEKFVDHPFIPGERMYRTGDLGRWLEDGNIQFLGRIDNQVKIRGYRIEPGEIENQLLAYESIKEAAVIDYQDQQGQKYLCAYFECSYFECSFSEADLEVSPKKLREHLMLSLPEYMIPDYFIQLAKMPLTKNGKVDRKALPEPKGQILSKVEYNPPRNQFEEKLVLLFRDILKNGMPGIDDNFFELGGNSLKAMALVSKIHKELNLKLAIHQLFAHPTVRELAKFLQQSTQSVYSSIKPAGEKEYYATSSAQRRIYLLQQMDLESTGYNMPGVLEITGDFNLQKLAYIFSELIKRHEILRTSFHTRNDRIVQQVHKQVEFTIELVEKENLFNGQERVSGELPKELLDTLIQRFVKPFDLSQAPLLRIGIIKLDTNKHILMFDMHHIIADGISMGILIKEFVTLYDGGTLDKLVIQYKDYAEWQNQLLESDDLRKQADYWIMRFSDEIPIVNLPTDYPRPANFSFAGDNISFSPGVEVTKNLQKLAYDSGSTIFMILLSGINILLAKYSGIEDIVVGSTTAGRPHGDLEKVIGMFVNTLAMRNSPNGEKLYIKFLEEVKTNTLQAFENQDYQFEELINQLGLERELGRNPLFNVMFTMLNMELPELKLQGLQIKPYNYNTKVSKFDLGITVSETDDEIIFNLMYSTRLFKPATIERLKHHLINILGIISSGPNIKLQDIDILTPGEKIQLLMEFNDTTDGKAIIESWKTLQMVFEEQVAKTPDNLALIYLDKRLTYQQVNERSNQLAWTLREKGVQADCVVGLFAERSLDMMIGILAILKAGGAYLPIALEYPAERINYMLTDSGTEIILTQSKYIALIQKAGFKGSIIDLKDSKEYSTKKDNPGRTNEPENLAYILYTSGSTGKPKGVMVEHQGVINTLSHLQSTYPLEETDIILQSTVYTFDASVREICWWFFNGASCCLLVQDGEKNPYLIVEAIEKYRVTTAKFVPILLNEVLKVVEEVGIEKVRFLKYLFVGGEALSCRVVDRYFKLFGQQKRTLIQPELINVYGPSETTIHCTEYAIDSPIKQIYAPIGKPITNDKVYVLDQYLKPVPIGVPGELYISGIGLGRAYLNNPTLTAERFMDNPFEPGQKMYKTGDLVRWLSDGNLEFIGRIDFQVKIRGYRIEPGEIENQLLNHQKITEAVVLVMNNTANFTGIGQVNKVSDDVENLDSKTRQLCAYLVSNGEISSEDLKEFLAEKLPEYMIPDYYIFLDQLPLTLNGKIDRKALPLPTRVEDPEFAPPSNEIEAKLVTIFEDVLNVVSVGINDNFFLLGGHSLKANVLTRKIYKEMNVKLPLGQVFTTPTVKGLAEIIKNTEVDIYQSIQPAKENSDTYPVSSAQKRLFILYQIEEDNTSYNIPGAVILKGDIDLNQLESAFQKLINRHEVLRTSFEFMEGQPVQRIHQDVNFKINLYPEKVQEEQIKEIVLDFIQPFDLCKAPLLRVTLVELIGAELRYLLLFDIHHIISDGSSNRILIKEVIDLYANRDLPELKIQYKDFSVWQNQLFSSDVIKRQEKYWLNQFSGEIPVLDLPLDYPRPIKRDFAGDRILFTVPEDITVKLEKLAVTHGATLYMVLLAAYNILLARYSNQSDIIIGMPIAGRNHADLEKVMGMFVNTLALRNYPDRDKTFAEFFSEVKDTTLQAYENQDYQFEMLVDRLKLSRDMNRNPLFDVMLVLQNLEQNYDSQVFQEVSGLSLKPYMIENLTAKFDLILHAIETDGKIKFDLEYSTILFARETIERFAEHFVNLLNQLAGGINIKLAEYEIMSNWEREMVLEGFNATKVSYSGEKTIHQLFEEQVLRTPEKPALYCDGERLTYYQLNQWANLLAHQLRDMGVSSDTIVGIMVERSFGLVVGILGILKAGGGYLPIDTQYPPERIQYMLEDSQARILLADNELDQQINFTGKVIDLDKINLNFASNEQLQYLTRTGRLDNPEHINTSNDLVYLIYTSGSTGQPKGVMLEHRNLVNLLTYELTQTNLDCSQRVLQFTTISFDVSFQEIFSTLLSGGELFLVSQELRDSVLELLRFIAEHQIDTLFMSAAYVKYLFGQREFVDNFPSSVKHIVTAGEQLIVSDQFKKYLRDNGVYLHNHYGPSETHVVTTLTLAPEETIPTIPTIGKPIANTRIYIVDQSMHLQPIGVIGELLISGDNVGRGYYNQKELTEECFIVDPFDTDLRVYKTGDLARWRLDGMIEFIGRADHQVKIRGFRIESGEVETQLLNHPEIKDGAVIPMKDPDGSTYLCGYFVADSELRISEIKNYLAKSLPDYMIPSYFLQLESLPLTPNGKVNRKALAQMKGKISTGIEYIAPRTDLEVKLAKIWAEILNREQVGIKDNFFDLGGHSLKGMTLVARIYKEFNVEMPLRKVFTTPTIEEQARFIATADRSLYPSIESAKTSLAINGNPAFPLSSAQKRLYVLSQMEQIGTVYNLPVILKLEGHLNLQRLKKTFQRLIARHEAFRTSFGLLDGKPVQIIHPQVSLEVIHHQVTNKFQLDALLSGFRRPFDLTKAPLLRVEVITYDNDEGYNADIEHNKGDKKGTILLCDMHHIISDGTSMGILIKEFAALYANEELLELPIQYKDYAAWQNQLMSSEIMKKQEEYWLERFSDKIPVVDIPTDYPRPAIQSFAGDTVTINLDQVLTGDLRRLAKTTDCSLYMVLLAGINVLLSKYTGQEDIIIGTPIAGRTHADLENIIGMFVNTLVMRNQPEAEKTYIDFLFQVKENTLKAFEHQDYQFEELVEVLNLPRDLSRNPLFDVMFSVQNIDWEKIDIGDLKVVPFEQNTMSGNISKFDLTISASENQFPGEDSQISLYFEYCTKLFKRETIERMTGHFITILKEITAKPDIELGQINMLTLEEKERILYEFNNTQSDYPEDKTILELFAEQVKRTPGQIAVVFDTIQLTYQELDIKSTQLARRLRQMGVGTNQIIPILMEPSLEMIIGLMGILKAGGAYVPIDVQYPVQRIEYILNDVKAEIILTQSHLADIFRFETNETCVNDGIKETNVFWLTEETDKINANDRFEKIKETERATTPDKSHPDLSRIKFTGQLSLIDNLTILSNGLHFATNQSTTLPDGQINGENECGPYANKDLIFAEPERSLHMKFAIEFVNKPEDLAYVIYTSGSTGQPKGVMVEHRSLTNLLTWFGRKYDLKPGKRVLQMTNYTFDPSVEQIFGTLIHGATLYLLKRDLLASSEGFCNFVEKNEIQVINFVPSALRELLLSYESKLNSLEVVISGGENLDESLKDELLKRGYTLFNHYGPTETTVDAITDKCGEGKVSLGHPINNTRCYILDSKGNLLPIGSVGELWIAGVGVSRGYLNNPELTATKFIPDPFFKGERMYQTGDLARWRGDGQIEYLGRIDRQVKIRGFRIELGEIENRLLSYGSIKEVIVIDQEDNSGVKFLTAYLVGDEQIEIKQLKRYLAKHLPEYMIPVYFVQLNVMPHTESGKIDTSCLPKVNKSSAIETDYQSPRNELEAKLVQIWKEVLSIDDLGINHNFFEMGGHSLKATSLIAQIHRELNVQIPFSEVFKNPTIRDLAEFIRSAEERNYTAIQPLQKAKYYPVSSAQRRMYLQWQLDDRSTAYNMPSALILEGELNQAQLQVAIQKLVKRHEALRTSFVLINGHPMQIVHETAGISISYINGLEEKITDLISDFVRPFDLHSTPLMRVALIRFNQYKHLLIFDMHHIISDGISRTILARDFTSLYADQELPPLKIQYKDYAVWHNSLLESKALEKMRDYWLKKLKNFTHTQLPAGNLTTNSQTKANRLYLQLDSDLTTGINGFCSKHQITRYVFMLAVFKIIIMKLIDQSDITIGVPVAGRRHAELDNIIGVFLNVLVLRSNIQNDDSFIKYLLELKDDWFKAQENQEYPYEHLYTQFKERWNFREESLFSILFNYMPYQKEEELKLKGLNIKPYSLKEAEPKYSLVLYVYEGKDHIFLSALFANHLREYMIENMLQSFPTVIETILNNHEVLIRQISLNGTGDSADFSDDFDVEFDNDDFF